MHVTMYGVYYDAYGWDAWYEGILRRWYIKMVY